MTTPAKRFGIAVPAALLIAGSLIALTMRTLGQGTAGNAAPLPTVTQAQTAVSALPAAWSFAGIDATQRTPPLALVSDTEEGAFYSRDVNRINGAADVGLPAAPSAGMTAAESAQTWLATEDGVKCIDRLSGHTRFYRTHEGLPGTRVVAIAADPSGLFCLVRDPQTVIADAKAIPQLHLCRYDVPTDRWQQCASLNAPYVRYVTTSGRPSEGRCLLALTPRYAVIVSGVVRADDENFALLWDRQSGKSSGLPWYPDLRADVPVVLPTSLLANERGIAVGSDHGLLRWNFAEKSWNRLLSDRFVDCSASDSAGKSDTVWIVSHARLRPEEFVPSNGSVPDWNLTRVTLSSGTLQIWPSPDSPTLSASMALSPSKGGRFPNASQALEARWSVPCALFVSGDTVWTTHRAAGFDAFTRRPEGEGVRRFDARRAAWSEVVVAESNSGRIPIPMLYPRNRIPAPYPLIPRRRPANTASNGLDGVSNAAYPENVRHDLTLASIPLDAIRPLALRESRPLPIDGQSYYADSEQSCIVSCFPDWLTARASGGYGGAPTEVMASMDSGSHASLGPTVDPDDSSRVWVVDASGELLIHGRLTDLPATLQGPRRPGYYSGRRQDFADASPENSRLKQIGLPELPAKEEPNTLAGIPQNRIRRVRVADILPVHGHIFCKLQDGYTYALGQLDLSTGKWTLYDGTSGIPPSFSDAKMNSDGDAGAWISTAYAVCRYDRATDRWERIFTTDMGGDPEPSGASGIIPKPRFGIVAYDSHIFGFGDETDILAAPPAEPDKRRYLHRQTVYRFDNNDGHLIATLPYHDVDSGWGSAMTISGKDDLWVGMNHGLFHISRNASPDAAWQPVALPVDPIPGWMKAVYPGPYGGLWVVTTECAYFWKHPHV